MAIARKAAEMLREEFGAIRVVLFGSLARGGPFDMHSDVDLAAWGLDPRVYYRVVSLLLDIDPEIEVSLVMGEEIPPSYDPPSSRKACFYETSADLPGLGGPLKTAFSIV